MSKQEREYYPHDNPVQLMIKSIRAKAQSKQWIPETTRGIRSGARRTQFQLTIDQTIPNQDNCCCCKQRERQNKLHCNTHAERKL